jgi:hypothetical protein
MPAAGRRHPGAAARPRGPESGLEALHSRPQRRSATRRRAGSEGRPRRCRGRPLRVGCSWAARRSTSRFPARPSCPSGLSAQVMARAGMKWRRNGSDTRFLVPGGSVPAAAQLAVGWTSRRVLGTRGGSSATWRPAGAIAPGRELVRERLGDLAAVESCGRGVRSVRPATSPRRALLWRAAPPRRFGVGSGIDVLRVTRFYRSCPPSAPIRTSRPGTSPPGGRAAARGGAGRRPWDRPGSAVRR